MVICCCTCTRSVGYGIGISILWLRPNLSGGNAHLCCHVLVHSYFDSHFHLSSDPMTGASLEQCFRITDRSSVCSYDSQHGFTANDEIFEDAFGNPISAKLFKTDITYPTLSDRQVIDSVVRHITGGWHQSLSGRYHVPSRWISTTARYDWAVWEMSRRLSSGRVAEVSSTTIPKRLSYSKRYRGTRLIGVDALPYLINEGYDLRDKSVQFARSSTEILWYGRIFQKHVSKHEIWTREVSTFRSAMIRLRIDDPARMLFTRRIPYSRRRATVRPMDRQSRMGSETRLVVRSFRQDL